MPSVSKKSKKQIRPRVFTHEHLMGSTVLGERGQVVIPKDIRDRLRLKPGHKLMVMVHKQGPIMLVPLEQMQQMIRQLSEQMSEVLKEK